MRGDLFVVAREHAHAAAHRLELLHRLAAALLQRVGEGEEGEDTLAVCEEEDGAARLGEGVEALLPCPEGKAFLLHEAVVAEEVLLPVHEAVRAEPRKVFHLFGVLPLAAEFGDTAGERVIEFYFEGVGDALCSLLPFEGDDFGLAFGERRRLIEEHRLDVGGALQCFGVFIEHAHRGAPARGCHDGDGRREPQRAGAGDDEHADAEVDGLRRIVRDDEPDREGDEGEGDDDGHEDRGDPVCKLLDGGFGRARFAHHADDARKQGIFPHLLGADEKIAARDDGSADRAAALRKFDGQALARDRRLIDKGVAFDDGAVHRDGAPLLDDDEIARLHFCKRHAHLFAVLEESDGVGREGEELFDFLPRPRLAPVFEPFAQSDERDDHCRRFEEEMPAAPRNGDGEAV